MKKQINKISKVLFLIGILLVSSGIQLVAQESIPFEGGKWQAIVDGQPSEGAFFYRFYFEETGDVKIVKQYKGENTITEQKTWKQVGNDLVISSEAGAEIVEFDGSKLSVSDDETLIYSNDFYEGVAKPYTHWLAIVHWILILLVLIMLNELFRRSKWATIAFFGVLTLALTIFVWPNQGVVYWFKWAKVYSVVFAVLWFSLIRYTKLGKYKWVKLFAALILAVNIAEAVMQDFSMGYLPNMLNGIAGVLNIVTLFFGWKLIGPDKSKYKDMVWPGMAVFWIVAYDVWNITYVYLNFPGSTSAQLMVLLSCTIPALFIKKGTWLQARGFTLAAWFMYYFTFPRFTEQMELLVPRNHTIMLVVALVSIVLNVVYFGIFIQKLRKKKTS